MEQSEEFKKVVEYIKSLEDQLSLCEKATIECQKTSKETEEELEVFFAKCMNQLAIRKAHLLKEVAEKTSTQIHNLEEAKGKLQSTIEACKQTLKGAALIYSVNKSTFETLLKGLSEMPIPQVSNLKITTKNLETLLEAIQKQGEVCIKVEGTTGGFKNEAMVTTFTEPTKLKSPWGICLNTNDNCFYVCDLEENAIKKITLDGKFSTFIVGADGPCGIVHNHKENVFYVTNSALHKITKISAAGKVENFVGGQKGREDGIGNYASFYCPTGITIDQKTGNIFVADYSNNLIRKITPKGDVTTLAGSRPSGYADGKGNFAKFNCPNGIFFDEQDNSLLVCDNGNHKLRRVQLNGDVSTLCELRYPSFVTMLNKTIFVSAETHKIYKITPQGADYQVEDLAGSGKQGFVDGSPDYCCFWMPKDMVVHEGMCFVIDGNVIRKITFV